jgi:hypothetical protein
MALADTFWSHAELAASIVLPLGSGIGWLIWNAAQQNLKTNTMWSWFTNHGHDITGYRPGDEFKKRGKR